MAPWRSRETSPFEFEVKVDVDVDVPPDNDPVDFEDREAVAFAAEDANCAPTANAAALKAAKEPLPSPSSGLTANTMPWPQ